MGGVHVNEVSAMEAAVRLGSAFTPSHLHGNVSILPVVNLPALTQYTEYNCPIDGKNINFSFPGRPDGSFSEALTFALLNEWAADAEVLIDLHGGDLRESIATWVMFQHSGDVELDARNEALVRCFNAQFMEPLKQELMNAPGRACTGRATQKRLAVMSEGGSNGLVDPDSVQYHMTGVLNVARHLGMIEGVLVPPLRGQIVVDRRVRLEAPAGGLCESHVKVSAYVTKGQVLAKIRDFYGNRITELRTSVTGFVLSRFTHPVVEKGQWVMSIAVPADDYLHHHYPNRERQ